MKWLPACRTCFSLLRFFQQIKRSVMAAVVCFYGLLWHIQFGCVLMGSVKLGREEAAHLTMLTPPCFTVGNVLKIIHTVQTFFFPKHKPLPKCSIFVFVWLTYCSESTLCKVLHAFKQRSFVWGVGIVVSVVQFTAYCSLSNCCSHCSLPLLSTRLPLSPSSSLVWEHAAHTSGDDSLWFHEHFTSLPLALKHFSIYSRVHRFWPSSWYFRWS